MQVLYVTQSIRIGMANDPGFRYLDSSRKDRLISWMNPNSKLRYLEAMPEQLIGVTRSVNIKFVIKGPVGGPGSRSLLWFLPRFPALLLVRFFLASESPMWRIRARLALYCMSWGIQPR
mgnify:CR=1 FL=1